MLCLKGNYVNKHQHRGEFCQTNLSGVFSPQMVLFIFIFCASLFLMLHVRVGLDQELSMPQVSRHHMSIIYYSLLKVHLHKQSK